MHRSTLQLWFAYPGDVMSQEVARKCTELLSGEEQSRLKCFRSEQSRREYLVAHALVRTALSQVHPVAPEDWRFLTNSYGKPRVDPDCGVRFNLSHSRQLVACLIANGMEVGTDVEARDRATEILGIGEKVFSPAELAQLDELGSIEALDRALSLWTLKEAYIKARGMGLSLPLKNISIVFGGEEGIRLELDASLSDDAARWQFCLFDHTGHRIALMIERAEDARVELWEMPPAPAMPRQLAELEQTWYPILRATG